MTPRQKAKELIKNLGIYNAIYVVDEILQVLEDYKNTNDYEWKEVGRILMEKKQKNER